MVDASFPAAREPSRWRRLIEAVLGAPARLGAPDPARLILWIPLALGVGAAAYFAAPAEPPAVLVPAAFALAGALAGLAVLSRGDAVRLCLLVVACALLAGFALAQQRTLKAAPPSFEVSERAVGVTGWIEAVERGGTRPRLLIRVAELDGAETAPRRIRVRAGLDTFTPGDAVRLRAVLSRPPGPAAPGGYDPARAAWYDGVALTGFAIADLEPADLDVARPQRAFAKMRWRLAERIRDKAGDRTGGVAAALLTGDRSGVSEADAEALRISGLGHILAISGLHMALFAGGVYVALRYLFACIEPYARARDPRKPAAVIALFAAAGYLILSGGAVSTQRAFVMAAVVLTGVLLDRRAFSLRSLAIAAVVVIAIAPESVTEAGFQMSFSAVAALIAVYEVWTRIRPERLTRANVLERMGDSLAGLTTTSVVAGAATGAFAAFHFQRMAAYGLIANLAAMPVFTFWVMPAGVVALALAPLGLEGPALAVMDAGLRIVLAIAHWTAGLEGAAVATQAAPGGVIALYAAGFAFATLGLGLVRLGGIVVSLVALGLWLAQTPPSMMISDGGVVVARFDDTGAWQATSLRASRFDTGVFLQRAGAGGVRPQAAPLACDALGCVGRTADGLLLAVTSNPESLAEDCGRADLVIFDGTAPAWRKRRCAAVLLDDPEREALGGLEFWVRDGRVIRLHAAEDARRNRIWSRAGAG
ncbi:MAG: ComEC/Rec2 family competence protein [Oceanicaulis sp.]